MSRKLALRWPNVRELVLLALLAGLLAYVYAPMPAIACPTRSAGI